MLAELKVTEFLDTMASDAPVPGGGSMAALCGASAAALIEMVSRLTIGKKGYDAVTPEMEQVKNEMERLRKDLCDAIDRDAQSFDEVMAAFKLPKNTEEEKKARSAEIQQRTKRAALVPLEVAEKSYSLLQTAEFVLKNGNKNAASDACVSMLLIRTAVMGAIYNVRINLSSIKDENFVKELQDKTVRLESEVNERVSALLKNVEF